MLWNNQDYEQPRTFVKPCLSPHQFLMNLSSALTAVADLLFLSDMSSFVLFSKRRYVCIPYV